MPERKGPTVPVLTITGTEPEELFNQYNDAATKIEDALSALKAAAPHDRDYAQRGSIPRDWATEEHENRIAALKKVRDDMKYLAEFVSRFI